MQINFDLLFLTAYICCCVATGFFVYRKVSIKSIIDGGYLLSILIATLPILPLYIAIHHLDTSGNHGIQGFLASFVMMLYCMFGWALLFTMLNAI